MKVEVDFSLDSNTITILCHRILGDTEITGRIKLL